MAEITAHINQDPAAFLNLIEGKVKTIDNELSELQQAKDDLVRQTGKAQANAELGIEEYSETQKKKDWQRIIALETEIAQKEALLEEISRHLPAAREAVHLETMNGAMEEVREKHAAFLQGITALIEAGERISGAIRALEDCNKEYSRAVSKWAVPARALGRISQTSDGFYDLNSHGLGKPLDVQTVVYLKQLADGVDSKIVRRYSPRFPKPASEAGGEE